MEPSGGLQPKGIPGRKKCILSFDGGGVRGLISAVILERLESYLQTSKGGRKDARVAEYFDGIAGTSTGALIACLLVVPDPETKRPKYYAKDAVNFYRQYSKTIFSEKSIPVGGGYLGPMYSSAPLEKLLKEKFQDLKLSETVKTAFVPTYDIKDGISVHFSAKKVKSKEIPDCFIRDVCRATSAVPTYFAPYYFSATTGDGVRREFNMVDGGICANNPTLVGISELLRDDSNIPESESDRPEPLEFEDLLVLSLGTGKTTVSYSAEDAAKWWTNDWIHKGGRNPILDMLTMASDDIVDYNLSNMFIQRDSLVNYLRVQTSELTEDQMKLDNFDESNLDSLVATAKALLQEQPKKSDKRRILVEDDWPTYDAALQGYAQWLVDEKNARPCSDQPSFTP